MVSSFNLAQPELSGAYGWHHSIILALMKVFYFSFLFLFSCLDQFLLCRLLHHDLSQNSLLHAFSLLKYLYNLLRQLQENKQVWRKETGKLPQQQHLAVAASWGSGEEHINAHFTKLKAQWFPQPEPMMFCLNPHVDFIVLMTISQNMLLDLKQLYLPHHHKEKLQRQEAYFCSEKKELGKVQSALGKVIVKIQGQSRAIT